MNKIVETPVFETNTFTSADYSIDPETVISTGNAEPTSRCLSGSNDFWASEEWAEPAEMPDGRKCTKYYLFSAEEITEDGETLDADCYPWDAAHVSRIVVNQD